MNPGEMGDIDEALESLSGGRNAYLERYGALG